MFEGCRKPLWLEGMAVKDTIRKSCCAVDKVDLYPQVK